MDVDDGDVPSQGKSKSHTRGCDVSLFGTVYQLMAAGLEWPRG